MTKEALQHTATYCNILQRTRWQKRRTATHCNTLQHTATHCNALQHARWQKRDTVTHCNTLQLTRWQKRHTATLQHTATHCTHCNILHDKKDRGICTMCYLRNFVFLEGTWSVERLQGSCSTIVTIQWGFYHRETWVAFIYFLTHLGTGVRREETGSCPLSWRTGVFTDNGVLGVRWAGGTVVSLHYAKVTSVRVTYKHTTARLRLCITLQLFRGEDQEHARRK